MVNFATEACGLDREVKFQKYSEWNYNNYFKIVDRWWFEMKTFEKYASGMYPKNILLWIHFTPFLVSGHVRTVYGAVIPNLR